PRGRTRAARRRPSRAPAGGSSEGGAADPRAARAGLRAQLEPADVVEARVGERLGIAEVDPRQEIGHRVDHRMAREEPKPRRELGVRALVVAHERDRKSTRLNSSHVAISYA